jgi:hypothetical protein
MTDPQSNTETMHDPAPGRMSPGRNEVFSPSYPQGHWSGNGRTFAIFKREFTYELTIECSFIVHSVL